MTTTVTSAAALQATVRPQAVQPPRDRGCAQHRPNGPDKPPDCRPFATFAARLRGIVIVVLIAAITTSCKTIQSQSSPQAWGMKLPDAEVTMKGGTAGVGFGFLWGHGVLKDQAEETAFCIRGLSIVDIGGATLDSRGFVYNLKSLDDFAGTYIGISGGFAVVHGESGLLLKNNHGVELELEARQHGLQLSIAASGVRIVVANTGGCKPVSASGGSGAAK